MPGLLRWTPFVVEIVHQAHSPPDVLILAKPARIGTHRRLRGQQVLTEVGIGDPFTHEGPGLIPGHDDGVPFLKMVTFETMANCGLSIVDCGICQFQPVAHSSSGRGRWSPGRRLGRGSTGSPIPTPAVRGAGAPGRMRSVRRGCASETAGQPAGPRGDALS